VTPPLAFLLSAVVLFVLFWGGSLAAQGYFYQQPADRLPLRAAAAALLVAGFLTFWVALDRRSPGKYDTFFEFSADSSSKFDEFEAVRWQADPTGKGKMDFRKDAQGNPVEKSAKFKRGPGAAGFVEAGTGRPFHLNDSEMMTAAVVVRPDAALPPTRFDAVLVKDARSGARTYPPKGDERRRFAEATGSRYVAVDEPGKLYAPSTAVVVLALLLNSALFVVWFAALWPVLQFAWAHALGLAAVFGLVTMLLVMPLLFKPNRTGAKQEAVARGQETEDGGQTAESRGHGQRVGSRGAVV